MKVKNRISAFAIMICMLSALFGIPAGAEGDYPYTVGNIYFTDLAGKEIDEVNGSCMVNLTVTKNSYRSQIDSIILSAYSSDGELIGFYMMRGSMSVATDTEFGALVRVPEGKKMGKVKAYVWDSLEGMKALSNTAKGRLMPLRSRRRNTFLITSQ